MKQLSRTRTIEEESDSRALALDRLTDAQKETMRLAVGEGLWEEILKRQDLPESVLGLIREKMLRHGILPTRQWWQKD